MTPRFRFLSLLSRLGKDKHASRPRLLARLLRDEEGSYLLIVTMAMPVFIGLAGLATEGALILYNHRTVQSAADAAAYSAAIAYSIDSSADITTQAEAIVANYGFVVGTGNNQANTVATVDTTTYSPLTAINVTITRPQPPILSAIWVHNPFSVSGSAKAIINGGSGGTCLLALGRQKVGGVTTTDASDAIHVQGNAGINMPGCGVFSNSSDCAAGGGLSVDVIGNGKIIAAAVGTAGCIDLQGNAKIGPPPQTYTQNDARLINPYAGVSLPSTPAPPCQPPPLPSGGGKGKNQSITLSPGRYCHLNGDKVDITLTGGIYILDSNSTGTTTLVVKNATLTDNGAGSTLVFTSSTNQYPTTMMDVQANGKVNLTAPTTGATAGLVIMGDQTMPFTTTFSTVANATVNLNGTVYLPNGFMDWSGNANTALGCRQFIVNTIKLQGDPKLASNDCNLTAGQKPIGNMVTLVR